MSVFLFLYPRHLSKNSLKPFPGFCFCLFAVFQKGKHIGIPGLCDSFISKARGQVETNLLTKHKSKDCCVTTLGKTEAVSLPQLHAANPIVDWKPHKKKAMLQVLLACTPVHLVHKTDWANAGHQQKVVLTGCG